MDSSTVVWGTHAKGSAPPQHCQLHIRRRRAPAIFVCLRAVERSTSQDDGCGGLREVLVERDLPASNENERRQDSKGSGKEKKSEMKKA